MYLLGKCDSDINANGKNYCTTQSVTKTYNDGIICLVNKIAWTHLSINQSGPLLLKQKVVLTYATLNNVFSV